MEKTLSLIEKVKDELVKKRKYTLCTKKELAAHSGDVLVTDPEVTTIYGNSLQRKNSLLLVQNKKSTVRLFVFDQNVSGSTDEKLPFLYLSALQAQEDIVIFIVNGAGLRECAFNWLKSAIQSKLYQDQHSIKKIWLKSFDEFSIWLDQPKAVEEKAAVSSDSVVKTGATASRSAERVAKTKVTSFLRDNAYSKKAVNRVEDFYKSKYGATSVANVENDKNYQAQDIDLIIQSGSTFSCEVKSDKNHTTGNIVLEDFSNFESGKRGWTHICQADYLVYAFPDISAAYVFSMPELRQWYMSNKRKFRSRSVRTRSGSNSTYTTKFHLIPLSKLVAEINCEQIKI